MKSDDANLEAYRQAFDTLRHYSSLRLAALTAFLVISGGLFAFALKDAPRSTLVLVLPGVGGILVSIAFGLYEWRINAIAGFYAHKSVALARELNMSAEAISVPPKSRFWEWCTPAVMFLVYGGAISLWIAALLAR